MEFRIERGRFGTGEQEGEREPIHRRRDPFRGSRAPQWLTFERVALFLSFLVTGGIAAMAEAGKERGRVEIARARLETEELNRVKEVFRRSAERIEASSSLREVYSEQEIAAVASVIREFPVQGMIDTLAQKTGLRPFDVMKLNDVQVIDGYTDHDISAFIALLAKQVQNSNGNLIEEAAEELTFGKAGMNWNRTNIFLNIGDVFQGGREDIQPRLSDLLTHEFLHGFPYTNFTQEENLRPFYEGLTEAFANRLGGDLWGLDASSRDPFPGYSDGPTAAANLFLASLDPPEESLAWRAYITGDLRGLVALFDGKFGEGSFERALLNEERVGSIGPLLGLLSEMGPEVAAYAPKANLYTRTGKIHPVEVGDWHGVVLTGEEAEAGVIAGALRLEREGESKVVLFGDHLPPNGPLFLRYSKDVAALFDSVYSYIPTGVLVEEMSDAELQEVLLTMVNAHRGELDAYAQR